MTPAPSPFHAAREQLERSRPARAPLADRRPVTTHNQLVDAIDRLQETIGAFAQAVDALADTAGSPGAGPQHRLRSLTDEQREIYDRAYRAGYSRAWRKSRAYDEAAS